jgi:hypothetical protein
VTSAFVRVPTDFLHDGRRPDELRWMDDDDDSSSEGVTKPQTKFQIPYFSLSVVRAAVTPRSFDLR